MAHGILFPLCTIHFQAIPFTIAALHDTSVRACSTAFVKQAWIITPLPFASVIDYLFRAFPFSQPSVGKSRACFKGKARCRDAEASGLLIWREI
jgi:hypothetical protein